MIKTNVQYTGPRKINIWRKIALNTWKQPEYSTIYSRVELNASPALDFLKDYNRKNDQKITLTHIVGKTCGEILKAHPELNSVVRGSKLYQRKNSDVFFHVSVIDSKKEENLSGHTLRKIDTKSLQEVAKELSNHSKEIKKGDDKLFDGIKSVLKFVPSCLVSSVIAITTFIQYRLNLWSPLLKTQQDSFGSMMLTNVGSGGVEEAFVPFVPYTKIHSICSMGMVTKKPVVDGDSIIIGKRIVFCWTLDHRLVDGSNAAKMLRTFKRFFENPHLLIK